MDWIHVAGVMIRWLVVSNVVLKVTTEKFAMLQVIYHFLQKLLLQELVTSLASFLFLTQAEKGKILRHQCGWIHFIKSFIKLNPDL
jgi:hypothetical protein